MATVITKPQATSRWLGGGMFEHRMEGSVSYKSDAPMDGKTMADLEGPKPMEMLLGALAGCTGVDVVSMLEKMRVKLTDFRISMTFRQAATPPKIYEHIHVDYYVESETPDLRKVVRAVRLSANKYCSVSAMLAGKVKLTYAVHHGGEIAEGVMHEEDQH